MEFAVQGFRRVKETIESLTHPLPQPEEEARNFWGEFANLTNDDVTRIVGLVLREVDRSRNFGLVIENDLLKKEELFYLTIINSFGGVDKVSQMDYEELFGSIGEIESKIFEKERRDSFEKLRRRGNETNTKLLLHQMRVREAILRRITEHIFMED